MRYQVYSFAGCVTDGAPLVTPFEPCGELHARGMGTEAALRLLSGESLAIEDAQLTKIRAANGDLPSCFGRYEGLDTRRIRAIIWTPVVDATYLIPLARCPDKTVYPANDHRINEAVGNTHASLSYAVLASLWFQLDKSTASIPGRIAVRYPTTHLGIPEWKHRIDSIQRMAAAILSNWKWLDIEPDLTGEDGYWAHYSLAARQKLWDEIEKHIGCRAESCKETSSCDWMNN